MSEEIELLINNEDSYKGLNNIYYLPSDRIEHIRYLNDETFSGCYIRNTPTELLTTLKLSFLNQKLKDQAVVEIIIDQPIKVMQKQDERLIKMNALYAGFGSFDTKEEKFVEPLTDINFSSLVMTFKKEKRVVPCEFEKYHIQRYRGKKRKANSKSPKRY
jgi:hypothetical protein